KDLFPAEVRVPSARDPSAPGLRPCAQDDTGRCGQAPTASSGSSPESTSSPGPISSASPRRSDPRPEAVRARRWQGRWEARAFQGWPEPVAGVSPPPDHRNVGKDEKTNQGLLDGA